MNKAKSKLLLTTLLTTILLTGCSSDKVQSRTMNEKVSTISVDNKTENENQTTQSIPKENQSKPKNEQVKSIVTKEKPVLDKNPVVNPIKKIATKDQKFIENVKSIMKDRSGFASVAVYDENTEKTYMYETDLIFKTASIVKIALLADLLHAKGSLTKQQKTDTQNMIEHSDNDAATSVWNENGQGNGMQNFFNNIGMAKTTVDSEGYWGKTLTNAVDQVSIMKRFAYSNSYLTDSQRNYGLSLMENVESDQRWGVSSGVPTGVNIALKNGWSDNNDGTWRINSVGYINGQGRNYVVAILTDEDPTEGYGILTIERISKTIWDTFAS